MDEPLPLGGLGSGEDRPGGVGELGRRLPEVGSLFCSREICAVSSPGVEGDQMPRWSQFMQQEEHSPGVEPVGDSKLDVAAAGGPGRSSKLCVLLRPDLGGTWQRVESDTYIVDLRTSLKGRQWG